MMNVLVILAVLLGTTVHDTQAYTVTCGQDVTITLDSSDEMALSILESSFSVGTNQLTATEFGMATSCITSSATLTFDLSECDATFSRSGGFITYTYTLHNVVPLTYLATTSSPVLRFKNSCIQFSCSYVETATLSAPFTPSITKVTTDPTTATGMFDFSMSLFSDSALSTPGTVFYVPDLIYVKVSLTSNDANLKTHIQSCDVSDGTDTATLIASSCTTSNTAVFGTVGNRQGAAVDFNFESFVFSGSYATAINYDLICIVTICDDSEGECTACAKKKRSLSNSETSNRHSKTVLVSKPFKILLPPDAQDEGLALKEEVVDSSTSFHLMAGFASVCAVLVVIGAAIVVAINKSSVQKRSAFFEKA